MRKRFLILFITIITVITPLFFAYPAQAVGGPPLIFELGAAFAGVQPKTIFDYGKEYCDKRSGDLMNLETWYSGKCTPLTDTLSGEGVGFSDIVILQGIEYLIGPQYGSFIDMIIAVFKALQAAHDKLSQGIPVQNIPELANLPSGGLIPGLAKITTTLLTTKPASSMDYIAYVSQNLKDHQVIKEAYAAGPGYGYTALAPILPLWRAFRNITYILFALAFVVYGVMIMLRVRIDAKTAATVQLAIPKLISTLLLITFSYSIVGFLIDISTLATGLAISVLQLGGILAPPNSIFVLPYVVAGQSAAGALGSFLINQFIAVIISPLIFFNLLIGGGSGVIIGALVGAIGLVSGIGVIIAIIIFLAIGFAYFKLIMKLFESFFSVIVNLIFAPIIIFGNILPGSNAFSGWIMSIVGNLAVFPTASFFLVLSYALMAQPIISIVAKLDIFGGAATTGIETLLGVKDFSTLGNIWTPPMTIPFKVTAGTATGSVGSMMLGIIGFGLLLMASKYVDMVKEALKVPPFKYGSAIGEGLKFGYNQAGDPLSGTGRSPLGAILRGSEGRYRSVTGGREAFDDIGTLSGQPKPKA